MEEKKYQTECGCHSEKPLKGISCDVENCTFNDGECRCHATCISVGPCTANCSSETVCATFKPKTY